MPEFKSDLTERVEEAYLYSLKPFYSWVGKGYLSYIGSSGIDILADDIAQEASLAVFEHYDSFKGTGSFKSWVYAIGRNKASDLIKEYITRPADLSRNYEDKLQSDLDQLYSETNPDNLFATKEKKFILFRKINELNPRQKLIARLHIYGVPIEVIARILGATPENIRVTICYIKKKLKKKVQQ